VSIYYDAEGFLKAINEAGPPPANVDAAFRDPEYLRLFYRYVEDQGNDPNASAFLLAITSINEGASLDTIWDRTGSDLAMIKAPWSMEVQTAMQLRTGDTDDVVKRKMWLQADEYLYRLYGQFVQWVNEQHRRQAEAEEEERRRNVEISAPTPVAFTRDMVDMAVVDNFNRQALKDLEEGNMTNFWQLGDLVVIAMGRDTLDMPYVRWIREQPNVRPGATIVMTAKGGVFDPGTITVSGVSDKALFEAAIKRVSKKKIKYS